MRLWPWTKRKRVEAVGQLMLVRARFDAAQTTPDNRKHRLNAVALAAGPRRQLGRLIDRFLQSAGGGARGSARLVRTMLGIYLTRQDSAVQCVHRVPGSADGQDPGEDLSPLPMRGRGLAMRG